MGVGAILSMLASAVRPSDLKYAVAIALASGIPLFRIEEYLDWANAVRQANRRKKSLPTEPAN